MSATPCWLITDGPGCHLDAIVPEERAETFQLVDTLWRCGACMPVSPQYDLNLIAGYYP